MRALAGWAALLLGAAGIAWLGIRVAGGAESRAALGPAASSPPVAAPLVAELEGPRVAKGARELSAPADGRARAPAVGEPAERAPRGLAEAAAPSEPWPPPVAGAIRGFLVREGGPWLPETAPDPSTLVLDLVSLEAPRLQRRGRIERVPLPERDELELRFAFEDVPRGSYELVLSSLDAHAWQPRSLVVAPPAQGLLFTRLTGDDAPLLAFRVLDAATLEPLGEWEAHRIRVTSSPDNGVLLHTGPLDFAAFPAGARFEWSLTLEGYATAFGDERAFHLEGTGGERRRVAEVHVERGWATRVLALGGEGTKRLLGGVAVLCDGELVGTTDASGSLVVRRTERPAALEARHLDWRPLPDPRGTWDTRPERTRAGVTPLLLEPPPR